MVHESLTGRKEPFLVTSAPTLLEGAERDVNATPAVRDIVAAARDRPHRPD